MDAGKTGTGPSRASDITHDAVVVIPGIMGSELVDTSTGQVLWGLSPGVYLSAWSSGAGLQRLHLCDQERQGRYGRVTASRLLQFPAWLPFLQGAEPYTKQLDGLGKVVADPAAVREFPTTGGYQWNTTPGGWPPRRWRTCRRGGAIPPTNRRGGHIPPAGRPSWCWWPTRWAGCWCGSWPPSPG